MLPTSLSIVMPCLNEEETLLSCISKAKSFIQKLSIPAEIIVADNGSTDNSISVIDFYAHRNFTKVENVDSARAYMQKYNISKAVWVEHRNFQLQEIVILR